MSAWDDASGRDTSDDTVDNRAALAAAREILDAAGGRPFSSCSNEEPHSEHEWTSRDSTAMMGEHNEEIHPSAPIDPPVG